MPGEQVKGMNASVFEGEIFGFGGLAGQGKIGIINGVMGLFPAEGDVTVFGEKLRLERLGDALKHDVAFVSEDRRGVGLLLNESIERNIVFPDAGPQPFFSGQCGHHQDALTGKRRKNTRWI